MYLDHPHWGKYFGETREGRKGDKMTNDAGMEVSKVCGGI